jgi:hypothetical protein
MALNAKRLSVRHVVPGSTFADRNYVVGLRHTLGHPPAMLALPRIPGEHGLTPLLVGH